MAALDVITWNVGPDSGLLGVLIVNFNFGLAGSPPSFLTWFTVISTLGFDAT